MDLELRELLRDMRESQERAYSRFELKLDTQAVLIQEHIIESARNHQSVKDSTTAAHRRIDNHEEGHKEMRGWVVTGILGIFGSLAASVWAWIKSNGGQK